MATRSGTGLLTLARLFFHGTMGWILVCLFVPCAFVGSLIIGSILAENNETGSSADFAELETQLQRQLPDEIKRIQNVGPLHWSLKERYVFGHSWVVRGHGVAMPSEILEERLAELVTPNGQYPEFRSDRPHSMPEAPIRFGPPSFDGVSCDRYASVHFYDHRSRFHADISMDALTGVFTFTLQGRRDRQRPVKPH